MPIPQHTQYCSNPTNCDSTPLETLVLSLVIALVLLHFTETGASFERALVRLYRYVFCYDINSPEEIENRIW
jgi:hypothetical protein